MIFDHKTIQFSHAFIPYTIGRASFDYQQFGDDMQMKPARIDQIARESNDIPCTITRYKTGHKAKMPDPMVGGVTT